MATKTITVTDIDSKEYEVELIDGQSLMEVMRDSGLSVLATCGGTCSCATCHVYLDGEWPGHLTVPGGEELDILEGTGQYEPGRSRLSCQIPCAEVEGGRLTVAPD